MISDSEVRVVQSYLAELYDLSKERAGIQRKMEHTEAALRSILSLHDEDEVQPYLEQIEANIHPEGFTDAIRRILRGNHAQALAATDVKERLPQAGFPLDGYVNPLASIHTILKRLAKTPDVKAIVGRDGATRYQWVGKVPSITRAYIPRGSFAERSFAQEDAKKRKK